MRKKRIRPKGRSISRRLTVLGVLGFLMLSGVFFCLGIFYLGPMLRAQMESTQTFSQSPSHVLPAEPQRRSLLPSRRTDDVRLDVEITERIVEEAPARDEQEVKSSDEGIVRDGNQFTITLDSRESQSSSREPSAPAPVKPQATQEPQQPRPASTIEPPRVATEQRHTPSAAATDETRVFRVQAGTYANQDNAEILVADLRAKGYKPTIRTVQVADRVLHRVQLGGYQTREDADALARNLSAHGYSPTVVQENRGE